MNTKTHAEAIANAFLKVNRCEKGAEAYVYMLSSTWCVVITDWARGYDVAYIAANLKVEDFTENWDYEQWAMKAAYLFTTAAAVEYFVRNNGTDPRRHLGLYFGGSWISILNEERKEVLELAVNLMGG